MNGLSLPNDLSPSGSLHNQRKHIESVPILRRFHCNGHFIFSYRPLGRVGRYCVNWCNDRDNEWKWVEADFWEVYDRSEREVHSREQRRSNTESGSAKKIGRENQERGVRSNQSAQWREGNRGKRTRSWNRIKDKKINYTNRDGFSEKNAVSTIDDRTLIVGGEEKFANVVYRRWSTLGDRKWGVRNG
jgi:hypothetical protein